MMSQIIILFMLEMFKIRKSLVIWIVALLFTIAPLMAGFFHIHFTRSTIC